ncbi:MAG TPA: YggT family protein [Dehalococcoidia bacterium]
MILSWVILFMGPRIDPGNPLIQALNQITDPILLPLRQIIPTFGGLDLSPMIAIFLLYIILEAVQSLA